MNQKGRELVVKLMFLQPLVKICLQLEWGLVVNDLLSVLIDLLKIRFRGRLRAITISATTMLPNLLISMVS